MTYKVSTKQITETIPPDTEPVTLDEMKQHLRLDGCDNDELVALLITASTQWTENTLQKSLVQRTYRADLPCFFNTIELPMLPLSSITQIQYYNSDSPSVLTTLASDVYRADTGYSKIYLTQNQSLPTVDPRHDAVQITFVSGFEPYGSPEDAAGNIPQAIKSAIKLQAADLFENRETNTQLRMQELPTTTRLLMAYREY